MHDVKRHFTECKHYNFSYRTNSKTLRAHDFSLIWENLCGAQGICFFPSASQHNEIFHMENPNSGKESHLSFRKK